jgi:NitT/TauT family transport system permease protein
MALNAAAPQSWAAPAAESRLAWQRWWPSVWPKLAAVAVAVSVWQVVVLKAIWPDYVLPGPLVVFGELARQVGQADFWQALAITLGRAVTGYGIAIVIGFGLGIAVARIAVLRRAIGSLVTGLQTMPSIAWFPLAILLFQLSEGAILFVVVLGAAPSIANGLLSGIDHVPPLLVRAGRMMGARGFGLYRHVVIPAALPSVVGGLKQGWAFAWRSLMAGELLVIVAHRPSLGAKLAFARDNVDAPSLLALMIVILVIGLLADSVFGAADGWIRGRWGLLEARN